MEIKGEATFAKILEKAHQVQEAQDKLHHKQQQAKHRDELRQMKRDVQEKGLFTDPREDDFKNLIYNFSDDGNTSGRYRRMDMVVDSGAFVSGVPPDSHR